MLEVKCPKCNSSDAVVHNHDIMQNFTKRIGGTVAAAVFFYHEENKHFFCQDCRCLIEIVDGQPTEWKYNESVSA